MNNKKIILCDADDVIEDLVGTWVKYLNDHYGTSVESSEIVDWDIARFFPQLNREDVYAPIYNKEFWKNIPPIEDECHDILKELNEQYELYIVTATNYQTCDTKTERILELFPFLKWSQFIITSQKHLIHGDCLIDDGIHNFVGRAGSGILFDRPHNRSFDEREYGIRRVYSWTEIADVLL